MYFLRHVFIQTTHLYNCFKKMSLMVLVLIWWYESPVWQWEIAQYNHFTNLLYIRTQNCEKNYWHCLNLYVTINRTVVPRWIAVELCLAFFKQKFSVILFSFFIALSWLVVDNCQSISSVQCLLYSMHPVCQIVFLGSVELWELKLKRKVRKSSRLSEKSV